MRHETMLLAAIMVSLMRVHGSPELYQSFIERKKAQFLWPYFLLLLSGRPFILISLVGIVAGSIARLCLRSQPANPLYHHTCDAHYVGMTK